MKKIKPTKQQLPPIPLQRHQELTRLQEKLGIYFKDIQILNTAFIHSSYTNESKYNFEHNERLEFLGDSVLALIVNEYLYNRFLEYPEGKLARLKGKLVSEDSLAKIEESLNLHPFLLLGKGEKEQGGAKRKSIRANLVEAVLGAIFLDKGLRVARQFILSFIKPMTEKLEKDNIFFDYKTTFQEYCQKQFKEIPVYEVLSKSGPDHDNTFTVALYLNGNLQAKGVGKSKKEAERDAAKKALLTLKQ
ncbi:MAG: ribonuclease III [Leptospiraceae bacterium]|nr:ribonuclease III [Leptospiraceae bacterium]MCP5501565.1 ribonuclease III [Leptospiraceae bacterium]